MQIKFLNILLSLQGCDYLLLDPGEPERVCIPPWLDQKLENHVWHSSLKPWLLRLFVYLPSVDSRSYPSRLHCEVLKLHWLYHYQHPTKRIQFKNIALSLSAYVGEISSHNQIYSIIQFTNQSYLPNSFPFL